MKLKILALIVLITMINISTALNANLQKKIKKHHKVHYNLKQKNYPTISDVKDKYIDWNTAQFNGAHRSEIEMV
jgi:hypothetical protein